MPFLRSLVVMAGMPVSAPAVGQTAVVLGVEVSGRQPSAVTTRVSSTRTPPWVGQVHTRLDGDDDAGGERSIGGGRHPRGLVDLEAHAVAGAVQEGVAPAGVVDDVAAGRVDRRRRPRPAPTASTPACWAAVTTSSMRAWVGDGLAHHDGAGHVRAVAVDQRAEVEHHEVALDDAPGRRAVVGLGPVRPGGHDRLERVAPGARAGGSRSRARGRTPARSARSSQPRRARWPAPGRRWRRPPRCGPPRRRPSPGAGRRPARRWPPARRPGTTSRRRSAAGPRSRRRPRAPSAADPGRPTAAADHLALARRRRPRCGRRPRRRPAARRPAGRSGRR